MSRCYACCQENCGYHRCSCDCHEEKKPVTTVAGEWTIADRYFYQAGPLPEEREEAKKAEETKQKQTSLTSCTDHPKYELKRKPTSECKQCWRVWQFKLSVKTWDDMSIRERIIEDLHTSDGRLRTAAQVAKYCGQKLSSVSSQLHKLYKQKLVLRVEGFGKNGGYGWVINPNKRADCLRLIGK